MLYAAIDIHKHAFQAAVLDPEGGEVVEARFSADRESLARWAEEWRGRVAAVAIEVARRPIGSMRVGSRACWRRRCCRSRGSRPRRSSSCATARVCARRSPRIAGVGRSDCTRFCCTRAWPCSKARLLTPEGLRWAAALKLPEHARLQVDSLLAVIGALEVQLDTIDAELRRFARTDARCQALQSIYGIGPILACHLLAEIGEASRFRRAEQITRLAGLDPVVDESGETRRRGQLAKAGSPHLRWAPVEAAVHANRQTAPDVAVYRATRARRDATVARLTVARKIGKRVYLALRELELAAA